MSFGQTFNGIGRALMMADRALQIPPAIAAHTAVDLAKPHLPNPQDEHLREKVKALFAKICIGSATGAAIGFVYQQIAESYLDSSLINWIYSLYLLRTAYTGFRTALTAD